MQQISNLEGLGDIRAKLNSTRIYQQFETVADLIASSRPVPEGEYVGVPRLGHWYIGAASGASDHHLTNAFGSKLYVLPESPGVWHFGAWGPDDTGATDIETKIEAALAVALASADDVTIKWPGGRFLHDPSTTTFVELGRGQKITFQGTGATVIDMVNAGFTFQPENQTFLTTTLASAAAAGDISVTLSDVTGVEIGDTIHFDSSVSIETGWNYGKEELRSIIDISGNTVWLHHPLYWPHSPADNGHTVKLSWPAIANIDGIHFLTTAKTGSGGPGNTFIRLTGGRMTNGSLTGETIGWTSGVFSDGPKFSRCIGVEMSWDLTNLRYAPSFLGSFGCRFHDATVRGIRHMDPNEWSQHTVLENIVSLYSQGVIQSHPSIGTIYRNIRDGVRSDTALCGFDLRGLGETVEHCSVVSKAPIGTENTNEPLIKSEFDYLMPNYRRTIKDLYAPNATIAPGRDGWSEFDRVTAYKINTKDRDDYQIIEIHPNCIQTFNRDNDFAANDKLNCIQRHKPLDVPLVRRFMTDTGVSTQTITSITQANPAVITIAGHGYSDGTFVYVYGGTMTQLVGYFTVTGATTDTFQLTTLDGDAVDSTSYTAYSSGGKATAKIEVDAIDLNVYPGVGQMGKSHVVAKLSTDEASSFTRTFMFRPWTENNVGPHDNSCRMTFTASSATGFSERVVAFNYKSTGAETPTIREISSFDGSSSDVTIGVPVVTKKNLNTAEGASSSAVNNNAQNHLIIEVTVTATENVEWLTVEIEDWQANMPTENLR